MTTCNFEVGKVYKDGTGFDVEIVAVCDRPFSGGYTIIGIRGEGVSTYMPNGQFLHDGEQNRLDLIPPPLETERMTVWVWVWAGTFNRHTVACASEAMARDEASCADSLMPNCEPVRVEIEVLKQPRGR